MYFYFHILNNPSLQAHLWLCPCVCVVARRSVGLWGGNWDRAGGTGKGRVWEKMTESRGAKELCSRRSRAREREG